MSKNTILAVVLVGVIAVACVGGFFLLNGDKNDGSNDSNGIELKVGDYMTYSILGVSESGTGGPIIVDGTYSAKILEITDTQIKSEFSFAIYHTVEGVRSAYNVDAVIEWENIDDNSTYGAKTGSETVSTKWGNISTDIYSKVVDGETTKTWVGKQDGIPYALSMSVEGSEAVMVLSDTNIISGGTDEGVGDYAIYTIAATSGSTTFDGIFLIAIDEQTATQYYVMSVIVLYETTSGVRTLVTVDSNSEWENIDDYESPGVKTGNDTISTSWGSRNVDIYTKVINGESSTAYIGHDDGVMYKITMSMDGVVMTFTLVGTNLL